jgi:hypothetical protein
VAGKPPLDELKVPPGAFEARDASEILRAWIVSGGLQVSLRRAFDEPEVWGLLLVDLARHAARIYAAERRCTEAEALEKIRSMWDAEFDAPTDPGTTFARQ